MQRKLYFIRKFKSIFTRFKLHIIVEPFSNVMLQLAHMSKLSKWVHQQSIAFNDFYSSKWDYQKRINLYKYLNENFIKNKAITYLEFGVAGGHSFLWWLQHNTNTDSVFHGFDTFTGLPEDWGPFKKGDMSTNTQLPDVKNDKRAYFHQGLFQQTLPTFVKNYENDKPLIIHMDADLYSSTLFSLTTLAPFLKKGDIIFFDEFFVPTHEYLAFKNFTESYYINYKAIAAQNNYLFMAFEIC